MAAVVWMTPEKHARVSRMAGWCAITHARSGEAFGTGREQQVRGTFEAHEARIEGWEKKR